MRTEPYAGTHLRAGREGRTNASGSDVPVVWAQVTTIRPAERSATPGQGVLTSGLQTEKTWSSGEEKGKCTASATVLLKHVADGT